MTEINQNQLQEIKTNVAKSINQKNVSDIIINQFSALAERGELKFPKNYNVGNELKLAYLQITQDAKKMSCNPNSIAQALMDLVLLGLQIEKTQAYFITYGNQLKLFKSYFGEVACMEQADLVVPGSTNAIVIYKGDEVVEEIINGQRVIVSHKTNFLNRDNEILGAYAITTLKNGTIKYEIMTKKEIDKSWSKTTNANNKVQAEFPQEMAKRTVLRRLSKMVFNTSAPASVEQANFINQYNQVSNREYIDAVDEETKNKTIVDVKEEQEEKNATIVVNENGEVKETKKKETAPKVEEPIEEPDDMLQDLFGGNE